ncbi:unnamed protein product [Cercospora beticola]|nr:unnamed protein product [Cercospora beticola]
MADRLEEQKNAVGECIKAEIARSKTVKTVLQSSQEFWIIIRDAMREPPYNIYLSEYQCRGLYKTCRKAKMPLPDVRRYISKAVKRNERVRAAILREKAELAESEGKGMEKEAVSAENEEDAEAEDAGGDSDMEDLEMGNDGEDEGEDLRAVQMTLAVRTK